MKGGERGLPMDQQTAGAVAEALGGQAWHSGGGIWLVRFERADGKLVVVSDEVVCEYGNDGAFDQAQPTAAIRLH